MDKRIVLDKNILEDLYLNKMLSIRNVAKILNVNDMVVRKYLKLYNIPRRNKSWKSPLSKNGKEVPCEICRKMVYRKKYRLEKFTVFFCSWECEKEYQSRTRRTPGLPDSWRRRRGYKSWRKQVLKRDEFRCKLCASSNKLVAHHIIKAQNSPEIRLEVDNGVTLCQKCHIEIHKNNSYNYIKPLQEVISVENLNIGENLEIGNPEALVNLEP